MFASILSLFPLHRNRFKKLLGFENYFHLFQTYLHHNRDVISEDTPTTKTIDKSDESAVLSKIEENQILYAKLLTKKLMDRSVSS